DFAPYRRLLGPAALNIPHVVLTDGDPWSDGNHVLAGLTRAAKLAPPGHAATEFADEVARLAEGGTSMDTTSARKQAAGWDVFVGTNTLEIDLASLLATQMITAHSELGTSGSLQTKFNDAVRAVSRDEGTADDRAELLRRVKYVGKGSFAQRLAACIDDSA